MFDSLNESRDAPVVVYERDLWNAIQQLKKPWVRDHVGVCSAALRLVPEVAQTLAVLICRVAACDQQFDGVFIQGFVQGKRRGKIPMSKTHGLLPQPVFLNIVNRLIIAKGGPFIDEASLAYDISTCILCSFKGSQPQDVSFSMLHVLETARDRHDSAAVAQADVEQFHDTLPWGTPCA